VGDAGQLLETPRRQAESLDHGRLAVAGDSRVWHKGHGSVGEKSALLDTYFNRSATRFFDLIRFMTYVSADCITKLQTRPSVRRGNEAAEFRLDAVPPLQFRSTVRLCCEFACMDEQVEALQALDASDELGFRNLHCRLAPCLL